MSEVQKTSEETAGRPKALINRRRFLRGMAAAGAGLLAACAAGEIAQEPAPYRTATPFQALKSPQAPSIPASGDAAEGSISLEEFLQLSSLLTGVDNLDPALGSIYLECAAIRRRREAKPRGCI